METPAKYPLPLPPLPDFILEKIGGKELVAAGQKIGFLGPKEFIVKKGAANRIQGDGNTDPSQTYMTQELKTAILNGDYQALVKAKNQNQQDLAPNLTTIQESSDTARGFVKSKNSSNDREYMICGSNAAWIWSYTTDISTSEASDGTVQTQCVVQTGSYSKNSEMLGISYQTFENIPTEVTALGMSAMVSMSVGQFLKNLLLDFLYEAALDSAVAAAAVDAVTGGFMVEAAAAAAGSTIVSFLGAGIVGVLVAVLIFFIADFLDRSYGLTISVYNWDLQSEWDITNWYGDNAVVAQGNAGSGPWKPSTLLKVQNSIPGPFGRIPTGDPIAQYVQYSYQNDNNWFEGLGVAMQVTSADAGMSSTILTLLFFAINSLRAGFYFKYDVKRWASNLIGLSSNTSQSIGNFYNDSNSWKPSGTMSYTGPLDGRPDLTVTIITTSLNGDRGYNFDVHIGLKQSSHV